MREFRPKPFRQKATSEPKRSDGLTDEQHKAMLAEFDRRIMDFKKKWLRCRNRRCRRQEQCLAPPFACNSNGWQPPWTNWQYRRLRRDIVRKPPRV
jgi:hypothetical protein